MSLALKQIYQEQPNKKNVSKKEFEKAWVELMDEVRIMDQRLSTKADEVVLTMTLSHRQEIEELQNEILSIRKEIKKIKARTPKEDTIYTKEIQKQPFKNWFKKLQFSRN